VAYRIVWSLRALEDLEKIADYLATDSPVFASSFVVHVLHTAATLTISPDRGRHSPDTDDPHVRELFVKQHRLIYSVASNQVNIVRLVHMARNQ
jgi:toxin ParE1/3/4